MPDREAPRRAPYAGRRECDCPICVERIQLHDVATMHPDITARVLAMTFLGAMDSVSSGAAGAIDLIDCFD